ncbi:threonine dehydratase [Sediminihabitans luteus]|uniref:threonine ammonia-lyase n=1 Tax=Sediminihabitans luteus TaxID=1138585 RepID=A0A2M9CQT5_9CELL|nr:pyridoxal-phosphate dependent enzyme [Sediminihabitans luteus]PJJ74283.1 threonine dehydratase [Sediminihabitans luteus]GII99136.1 serine/threonine dehydratase [Sediminihabitans luteus]
MTLSPLAARPTASTRPSPRVPTFDDVRHARDLLAAHGSVVRTPTRTWAALDDLTGTRVVVKHEERQVTGAFKLRGALTLLLAMAPAQRARGIVGYSTGNHAQALAYAARETGTACTIVMPEHPNPTKAAAVEALGARLVLHGPTLTEAAEHAQVLAAQDGARYVTAAGEPEIVAGAATAYVEMLEDLPHTGTVPFDEAPLDVLLVPVGGGSGAAGACLAAAHLAPGCAVVGVQSASSPAAHDSWRTGRLVERSNTSFAEGLATGAGFALTQRVLAEHLADFVLVDDADLRRAQAALLVRTGTVVEGAGAAALAAVLADPGRFAGARVGVALTGGNVSPAERADVARYV